jgi:hypothetical protein
MEPPPMPRAYHAARRAAVIEALIPSPPTDVAAMRNAFSVITTRQWNAHVQTTLAGSLQGVSDAQFAKARFITEMYARACYSMLLISASGPSTLRLPVQAAALLPQSRRLAIRLGSALLMGLDWLLPRNVHRQLLLTSALMGMLDVVLDETAASGQPAVLRTSSLITRHAPAIRRPSEQPIVTLAEAARRRETAWQSDYWETVLQPAVRAYCLAEALAVTSAPDPAGMGHRWAGIDAAVKGMWYAVGPCMGLQGSLSRFERQEWNREQQWMADTSLLMQMIDDWVDQDEDRGTRVTPVVAGDWSPQSVDRLYRKTVQDLATILTENRVRNPVLRELFTDLFTDFLHAALEAMRVGVAA